jgi:hypothetical protein
MAEKLVQVGNNVVAFPDSMSDDEIGNILSGKTQPTPQTEQPQQQRSVGQELARQVGLTGRAALEGFTTPATAVLEAGRGLYNLGAGLVGSESRIPSFAQAQSQTLTKAGVPEPETMGERAVQAGAQAMMGTGSLAKMAPSIPALASDLARQIPVSGVAGLVSQPTAEVIKDYTGSDLAATIAALGAGTLSAGASGRAIGAAIKENKPIYTMDEVKQRAAKAYKVMDDSGVAIKPQSTLDMLSNVRQNLDDARMIPGTDQAKTVNASLDQMEKIIGTERVSFTKLEKLRQIGNDLKGNKDKDVGRLGSIVVDNIDNYISKLNGKDLIAGKGELDTAVKSVMDARKDWRNASRAQVLEDALNVAEIKKEMPNASESELIRRGFVNIAANKNKMGLFSDQEQNIIKSVIKGGSLDPLLSFAAQFNPARSKLSAAAYGAAALQSPAGAAGLAGTGYAADTVQSVLRRRAAQQAANLIASGQGLPNQPNLAYRGLFTSGLVPPKPNEQ